MLVQFVLVHMWCILTCVVSHVVYRAEISDDSIIELAIFWLICITDEQISRLIDRYEKLALHCKIESAPTDSQCVLNRIVCSTVF